MEEQTNDYTARKNEIMDADERKLAQKYLDYYKSAWKDKDTRGLFDKWQEIETYWEGECNLPEEDTDPGSNTNIVHPNIEGQVASMCQQTIAVLAQPRSPSEIPFADTTSTILEWVKDKNKMVRKIDVHERRRAKFGTGVFRVFFDPDYMDGFGLPTIEACNPAYVFFDPTITDIYRMQEGRFVIETINKSINSARMNDDYDEERVKAIEPGYSPMESDDLFDENEGETDEISKDSYLHMLVFTIEKKDGERRLRLVEMSGCGVILYDSFDSDKTFFDKPKFPYFATPMFYREGCLWAKGIAELLINTQDIIDDLDDQIRINARLTGNPQKLVDSSAGIDIEKWTNEPGLNIPCNDINAAKYMETPGMPNYIIDRRKYAVEYEGQRITRFSDQQTGQKQTGVDTATEALALQQAGAVGIDHIKGLLEETLSEVFEYVLEMVKEYYTEEQAFKITDKKNEFIWFRGSKLKDIPQLIPASEQFIRSQVENNLSQLMPDPNFTPEPWMPLTDINEFGEQEEMTKDAAFDIKVTVGAGLPNNKAFLWTMINEAYARGALDLPGYQRILRDTFGLPIEEGAPMMPGQPPAAANQPAPMSPDIQGMSGNGNPAGLGMLGGAV